MEKIRLVLVCLITAVFMMSSCKKDSSGVLSFEDTVEYMESDPRQFLAKLDTSSLDNNLYDENDATAFLLRSMCDNYIDENVFPALEIMEKCVFLLSESIDIHKRLESLLFLAKVYHDCRYIENEILTINHALDIAKDENEDKWIFYLYTYLSEIYLKNVDLLRYAEFQSMAKTFYKNVDLQQTGIYTKLAIGKTFIYNHKYNDAIVVFKDIEQTIGDNHAYYGYNQFLLGLAYFKVGDWKSCIKHSEVAMNLLHRPRYLFVCNSILTHSYASIDNVEKAKIYKQKAIASYTSDESVSIEIEFYKTCVDLARKSGDIAEEKLFLDKIIEVYDKKLCTLNDKTLNEALLKSEYYQKETEYRNRLVFYKFMAAFLIFVLIISVTFYISKKQKQAYRILLLNEQIEKLKTLGNINEETRFLIERDMEIARRVAYLKYSNSDKNRKLIDEIEKLKILDGNKLLNAEWNDFFGHIDIVFDGFYTKLIKNFPTLTDKDVQLCCMLLAGFRTEEIAAVWGQSIYTVHKSKTNVRKKLLSPEGVDLITFIKGKLS